MMTENDETIEPGTEAKAEQPSIPGQEHQTRGELLSHLIVFQIKLLMDGIRDALLIPISLSAALYGLFFNKEDPWAWYREVLLWGRASDHWIDLFDAHKDQAPPDFETLAKQTRDRLDADMKANKARKKSSTDKANTSNQDSE